MSTNRFHPLPQLTTGELLGVASLCCVGPVSPGFLNLAHEAHTAGVLADCKTLGDYAEAILRFRVRQLERMRAQRE